MQHTRETQPQPHTLKRELSIEHNDSTNVQFGEQWVFTRVVKRSMREELLTKSRDDTKAAASLESTPLSKWWFPQTRTRKSRASRQLQGHNVSSFLTWGCLESPLTSQCLLHFRQLGASPQESFKFLFAPDRPVSFCLPPEAHKPPLPSWSKYFNLERSAKQQRDFRWLRLSGDKLHWGWEAGLLAWISICLSWITFKMMTY